MKKTFTLIELIVVIAIIAILAAIVAPNAFRAIEKAKVSQCIRDLKSIQSAAMAYYADTGGFPPNDDNYGWPPHLSGIDFLQNRAGVGGWDGPYLEKWPALPWTNPTAGLAGDYQWQGAWADFDGNGVNDECIELNFWASNPPLVEAKALEVDKQWEEGNLAAGNFRWGRFVHGWDEHCVYSAVGFH